ncbi:MAG TPA: thiolase family protein [Leptospiraceae bacterium]|nr:thiolase family protein [Leptospiraceae bacterium]HMY68887.1 thiolase family protein [Leptospiraceae bacterium]HNF27795.1 thiolase family protein [Leptospiraceae bacterium]HNM06467.1 thiolase family protein [Leptospiraceae bacterium]HNN07163.1 thiolase family protein [Leptospiraceae bacterium]
MKFTTLDGERLVLAGGVRTPVGQAGKSYSDMTSVDLGSIVAEEIFKRTGVSKTEVDGVVAGEISQSAKAPNIARVISVKIGIPLEASAVTVANNCVSGTEAVLDAARRIMIGEGDFYLALGMETMSQGPFIIEGAKENSKTATVDKLMANWADAPALGVKVYDSIDEGLNDPIRKLNMAMTGELAAQNYDLTKKELDDYAYMSYKKAYDSIKAGKYRPYQVSVKLTDGSLLEDDEYIMSKGGMVENPGRFDKAGVIFDSKFMSLKEFYEKYGEWINKKYEEGKTQAAVTLFNACPRSDGAGAIFVTTESKAKKLGLKIQAYLRGWGMYGVDPAHMGIGMAFSMNKALTNAGLKFTDIDNFEIHEAFAATAMGSFREVKKSWGFDLEAANKAGKVNPNGGTLAIGHPLGATGIRVLLNQIMDFDLNPKNKLSLNAICAGGGVAGSIILERAN